MDRADMVPMCLPYERAIPQMGKRFHLIYEVVSIKFKNNHLCESKPVLTCFNSHLTGLQMQLQL